MDVDNVASINIIHSRSRNPKEIPPITVADVNRMPRRDINACRELPAYTLCIREIKRHQSPYTNTSAALIEEFIDVREFSREGFGPLTFENVKYGLPEKFGQSAYGLAVGHRPPSG